MDGVCQTESSEKETRSSSRQQERVEERRIVDQSREAPSGNFPGCEGQCHFSAQRWPKVLRGWQENGIAASVCSNCGYLAGNGRPASSTPGVDVTHGNTPLSGGIQICDPKCHVLSRTVFLMVTLHPNIARLEQLCRFIAFIGAHRASK